MSIRCLNCKSNRIKEVVNEGRLYFFCNQCQELYERAFDSQYGKDILLNTAYGKQHVSSGGLIERDGYFLVLKRRTFPYAYDFPGGHVEYNEDPVDTLKREILEETGLRVTKYELIFQGEINNSKCRYGVDSHFQNFYRCNTESDIVFLNPESEGVGWYTYEELSELNLVPGARYLFDHAVRPLYGKTHDKQTATR